MTAEDGESGLDLFREHRDRIDLVVLDLGSTPAIAQRSARANDIWEAVFPTIMMGDDRSVTDVWIGGKLR